MTAGGGAAIVGKDPGLQKGPYVAETYPVSVEQQYIVIEVGT